MTGRLPTYEYHCDSCEKNFDVVQSFHDDPLTTCPTCGSPVRKVFGNVGIVFKGSGFYKTDSRSGGSSKSSASDSGGSDGKGGSESPGAESSGSESTSGSDSSSGDSASSTPAPESKSAPKTPATPGKSTKSSTKKADS